MKSCQKILPAVENAEEEDDKAKDVSLCVVANLAKSVDGGVNVDEGDIIEWINCNANDSGFEEQTDEQIVEGTQGTIFEESEVELRCIGKWVMKQHLDILPDLFNILGD